MAACRLPSSARARREKTFTGERSSTVTGAQGFELRGGAVQLGDHLAVTPPGDGELDAVLFRGLIQTAADTLVLQLNALVARFQSIETIPKTVVQARR